jgi:futalosine hydrolase
LCGFGPIAAAAVTSRLIAIDRPPQVTLIGIAGALQDRAIVGNAYDFESVHCHGVGVGEGEPFRSAGELGWDQVSRDESSHESVGDEIRGLISDTSLELLTVCASSATVDQADARSKHFPNAIAEDMEGFAVAMACRLHNVPLRIVRGISNRAGDRRRETWCVEQAINAAVRRVVNSGDGTPL